MDSALRHPESDTLISPELVLVDPELAEFARQRLPVAPGWRPAPRRHVAPAAASTRFEPRSTPAEPSIVMPRRRGLAVRAVRACALAVPALLFGGVAVAMVASEVRGQLRDDRIALVSPRSPTSTTPTIRSTTQPSASMAPARPTPARRLPKPSIQPRPVAPPPRAAAPPLPRPSIQPRPVAPAPRTPAPVLPTNPAPPPRATATATEESSPIPSRGEVEARTLMLLQEQGAPSVPNALIDPSSGLIANNVHIVCRQVGTTRRFDCRLWVGPSRAREWLLTVVVASDGSQTFSWRGQTPG